MRSYLVVQTLDIIFCVVIPSPHLLVLATSERFLPAGGTFRAILANESHWLQPVLVLSVHWWPAPTGVGRVLDAQGTSQYTCMDGWVAARAAGDCSLSS